MRAPWTLRAESEFVDRLAEIDQEIHRKCKEALLTGNRSIAPDLLQREEEFDTFWAAFKALSADTDDSMDQLRRVAKASDGSEVYALVAGRWRALFRIDKPGKLCVAIKIEELSRVEAAAERIRHAFRFSLRYSK